jgi:hypothetical protein
MEVWVVEFEYDYEPGFVLGVYSTKEKARQAAAEHCEGNEDYLSHATFVAYQLDA